MNFQLPVVAPAVLGWMSRMLVGVSVLGGSEETTAEVVVEARPGGTWLSLRKTALPDSFYPEKQLGGGGSVARQPPPRRTLNVHLSKGSQCPLGSRTGHLTLLFCGEIREQLLIEKLPAEYTLGTLELQGTWWLVREKVRRADSQN